MKLLELYPAESSCCRNSSRTPFLVRATSIFFLFLCSHCIVAEPFLYSLFDFADLVLKKFQVHSKTERKVIRCGPFSCSCLAFSIVNTRGAISLAHWSQLETLRCPIKISLRSQQGPRLVLTVQPGKKVEDCGASRN